MRRTGRCAEFCVNDVADVVGGEEALPNIGLQLLDAQREAAILRLNAENNSLDLFALLYDFRWVLDALGPTQVGDVYEAVDSVFDFNEGTEIGEVANAALDDCTDGVFVGEAFPGIIEKLLHAERDAAVAGLTLRTTVSTSSPGLTSLEGCLRRLDQVISER